MALWICWNCVGDRGNPGKKFEAQEPVCSCGVDGSVPRYAGLVAKCEVIHFDPPDAVLKGRGANVRACDQKPFGGAMASGVPAVVSCKKCMATAEFIKECERVGEILPVPEADFVVGK